MRNQSKETKRKGSEDTVDLPWGIDKEELRPGAMKTLNNAKLAQFAVGRQSKTKFQRDKEEREIKRKKGEEEAAKVYEQFVASFEEDGGPFTSSSSRKMFVSSSIPNQPKAPAYSLGPVHSKPKAKPTLQSVFGISEPSTNSPPPAMRKTKKKREIDQVLEEIRATKEMPAYNYTIKLDDDDDDDAGGGKISKRAGSFPLEGDNTSSNLHIGNLPPSITEDELKTIFQPYGHIHSIKIMHPRSTEDRGPRKGVSGFVNFYLRKDANQARIHVNEKVVDGSMLLVGWGKPIPIKGVPLLTSAPKFVTSFKEDSSASTLLSRHSSKTRLNKPEFNELKEMLAHSSRDRTCIQALMGFSIDYADAAADVVDVFMNHFDMNCTSPSTVSRKLTILYVISDILHNCTTHSNASSYRLLFQDLLPEIMLSFNRIYHNISGRMSAQTLMDRMQKLIKTWENWSLYPSLYLVGLQATFVRPKCLGKSLESSEVSPSEIEQLDMEMLERKCKQIGVRSTGTKEELLGRVVYVHGFLVDYVAKQFQANHENAVELQSACELFEESLIEDRLISAPSKPRQEVAAEVPSNALYPVDPASSAATQEIKDSADDVGGAPIDEDEGDEDIDGVPMEDEELDGIPMDDEDLDGVPIEDEELDGVPMDDEDLDGVPMD